MKILAVLLALFYETLAQVANAPCEVIAKTESGLVCGLKIRASNGNTLASFVNVRYAKPPLGKLRFADPQHPDPFHGLFNATVRGHICPQTPGADGVVMRPLSMGEDCLHANVHVPIESLPDTGTFKPLLPVLAFIHGGSFEAGSGDPDAYGPELMGAKGILLVTFNYRLNFLGFLSLNSKYIPGNTGLKDIIFALKWIQRNIRNFGGDPEDVTLGGVSSGACLAHLVTISPEVKGLGLFKKVILMSGTALSEFFSPSPVLAKIMASIFLQKLGLNPFLSPNAIHRALISAPIEVLLEALKGLQKQIGMRVNFTPVIESPIAGVTPIIPKDPEDLVDEGYGKEYPMLLSFTNNECQAYRNNLNKFMPKVRESPFMSIPPRMLFKSNILTLPLMIQTLANEYFNGSYPNTDSYMNMCVDAFYRYASLSLVEKRLVADAKPTYLYEFGYEYKQSKNVLKEELHLNWTGVAHTEDFSFVFRTNGLLEPTHIDELDLPESDFRMKDFMTSIFVNFIKTGRPTTDPTKWPPSGKKLEFLKIEEPFQFNYAPAPSYMIKKKRFFNKLKKLGRLESYG